MKSFQYECMNKQGQMVKGQLNAESVSEAIDKIRRMDLSVIDLKEYTPKTRSSLFEKKVNIGELTLFSRQLAAMIGAGIPVTRALSTLSRQVENSTLRTALENITINVEGGMSLTDSFSAYPQIFSDLYFAMIHSGEIGGMLDNALLRLSDQLQKEKVLKDEVKSAVSYPKTIGIFAVAVFIAMLIFLVPIFQGFIPASAKIPGITKIVFNLSESIRSRYYIWILVVAAVWGGIAVFLRSSLGRGMWENTKLTMPIFGPIIKKSVIARFTRTLATLLEGGIPVVQALESAGPTSGSDLVAEAARNAAKRIEEGKNIASTLEESGVFPPMVTHMIAIGEETGALPSLLDKVAEFYEQEVSAATRGLQALIQPVALVLVGILVGGMLIALYLPIFTSVTGHGG